VIDPWRWLGRRRARRWPAERQWRRGCRGLDSSELLARLSHRVRVGAQVGAREKLRVAGWSRARAKLMAGAADCGVARA
jgi:hypothetical protein